MLHIQPLPRFPVLDHLVVAKELVKLGLQHGNFVLLSADDIECLSLLLTVLPHHLVEKLGVKVTWHQLLLDPDQFDYVFRRHHFKTRSLRLFLQ